MRNEAERKIIEDFLKSPLFDGCDASIVFKAIEERAAIRNYSSGETIMSHGKMVDEAFPSIAYVYKGKCLISSTAKANPLLRVVKEKELIGLAGVFLEKEIETRVVAVLGKKVTVLSLNVDDLNLLMNVDKTDSIRNNLFKMLAKKISFLNEKIVTLTGGSAEKKLAMYLLSFEKDEFELGLSMSALSSMLDIGRSSLYRSMDAFESKGVIKRNEETITILNKDYLFKL